MLKVALTLIIGLIVLPVVMFAQSPATPPAPGAAAPAGASASSMAIESQMIAYDAINELAGQIALNSQCLNDDPKPTNCNKRNRTVLLGISANMAAIASYFSFKSSVNILDKAYDAVVSQHAAVISQKELNPTTEAALGTAAGALLTALKGQTTMSYGTFTLVDQALYTDLEGAIYKLGGTFVSTAYPANLDRATGCINANISDIYKHREKTVKSLDGLGMKPPDILAALKDIDTQVTALQASLTTSSPTSAMPTILWGGALLNAVKMGVSKTAANTEQIAACEVTAADYDVLTITNDGAGGGIRANTYFLLNVFIPAPHPSYNGGAVVSYTLRKADGTFTKAETLRLVFGYSKWKERPLYDEKGKDGANFGWDPKTVIKGHWVPRY
jgi:hypothetical protein